MKVLENNYFLLCFLSALTTFVVECTPSSKPVNIELERVALDCDTNSFFDSNVLFQLSIKNNQTVPIVFNNEGTNGHINTNNLFLASKRFNNNAPQLKLGAGSIVGNVELIINRGEEKKVWFYIFTSTIIKNLKHDVYPRNTQTDLKTFLHSSDFAIEFTSQSDSIICTVSNSKQIKYSCGLADM